MIMKKIGVLGSGIVGEVLANGFLKHGYSVMRGSRSPEKLGEWKTSHGEANIGDFKETAAWADIIVLCVQGLHAVAALELVGDDVLSGKTIIDATNPISGEEPVNGVISFFTGPNESLMEQLQSRFTQAHFVKAFSSVGNPQMVNPDYNGVLPTMFICGNSAEAKADVTDILTKFGWETGDMGQVEAARAIEPLCILWCIPGFLNNSWNHAFKILKP
ncbi:MAG: NAD(P)-binding domain-containing protein [Pseudobacteriovorax sp.]|nr:NAD(P)-binding domain-containing protein [Pseudobacteriovorax sp.]